MVTAFALHPDGSARVLTTLGEALESALQHQATVWIDLLAPQADDVRALGEAFKLDAEAIADTLSGEHRPRIDEFEDHIFLVLYGLLANHDQGHFEPRKLAVFCGRRFLITIHDDPIRSINSICERCTRNIMQTLFRGADFALYLIVDRMVDNYVLVTEQLEDRVEQLEDRSLEPDVDESLLADSATVRRVLLNIRRLAISQRELLLPVADGEYDDVINEAIDMRIRHVCDHLTQVLELTEVLRERLDSVRENYNTQLAQRTNVIMKNVSIMATILLPLTLVAGIYGMNLPLWPPQDHPASFWGVIAAMVAIAGALLAYFRRNRWL